MRDYIICAVFWLLFTSFIYLLGRVITLGKKSEAQSLITGYLVYCFPIAVGGMLTQFTNLPWIYFAVYIGVIFLAFAGFILYRQRKSPVGLFQNGIWQYIKENWVIYAGLCVFAGMLFFYYKGFWLGNHLDDGYYITKVAVLPYTHTGYGTNYAVGVENAGFDSYILGTWELEASVYVKMLSVKPTLFLRLFQSIFNYFLFLNVVKGFAENILRKLKIQIHSSIVQYPITITTLFGSYYIFLSETSILPLRDMFQFNTGMFLGASITKMMGIMLLLFFYLDAKKLDKKMVMGVIAISVILVSKSTIVLPVIMVITFSYVVSCLLFHYGRLQKIIAAVLMVAYSAAAIILSGEEAIRATVYSDLLGVIRSPVFLICLVIFIGSFFLKERKIYQLNCIMMLCAGLMLIPYVSYLFQYVSFYKFVSKRAFTTWAYTFILINSVYLCAILVKFKVKDIAVKVIYISMGAVLTMLCAYGFNYSGDTLLPNEPMRETNVKYSLSVLWNNKYFIPNSTIFLGEKLEQLSKEKSEKLYVVSPEWVDIDQTTHALAVMLRTYAPDVISVSAAGRYPVNNGSWLEEYDQSAYDQFTVNPNKQTSLVLEEELENKEVNCIVVNNEQCAQWLKNMGFELYDVTEDDFYAVWYR
jgi:hypothetical protein